MAKEHQERFEVLEKKIALMSTKEAVACKELEQISELNAQMYGHHNPKQKIKLVGNMKNENIQLKHKEAEEMLMLMLWGSAIGPSVGLYGLKRSSNKTQEPRD